MTQTAGYSALDRLLYRIAFRGIEIQKSLADIEDRIYGARLENIRGAPPIFVTSLPRAGTTLLLDALAALPGMTTHTYRQMPFVLCPILWQQISAPLRQENRTHERAHRDGMVVGYDSPEAFEETIWQAFWRRKYSDKRITLWTADDRDAEFEQFLSSHMRKLILLKNGGSQVGRRYVSKNNANIARVPYLRRLFSDCVVLVPFRSPLDQARSLLRQHLLFSQVHGRDSFAKEYMAAIGHLEFGELHRPIAFAQPEFFDRDPTTVDYWLAYWIAAFAHLAMLPAGDLHFVDYDAWCAAPRRLAVAMADLLGVSVETAMTALGTARTPTAYGTEPRADPELTGQALTVHDRLKARSINRMPY